MGVDLSRADTCMPEELLDRTEVGASFQEVRCEAVSKRVGCHVSGDAGCTEVPLQDDVKPSHAQSPSQVAEEERMAPSLGQEVRAPMVNVSLERADRHISQE